MIDNPGTATASVAGYVCYMAFRERMDAELGEDHEWIDFHRLVLDGGPMPMEILERAVDRWIDSCRKAVDTM